MRNPVAAAAAIGLMCCAGPAWAWPDPLPTTLNNFYLRGSQPDDPQDPQREPIWPSWNCMTCHEAAGSSPIGSDWAGSLMAHSARDPLFYACLEIAEADAPGSGDSCIRCHVPKAWLEGRSTPTNGSSITQLDRDSISCNFCHRVVDPFSKPGPPGPTPVDAQILADLGADAPIQSLDGLGRPGDSFGASYVIDPFDRRRGPFPVNDGSHPVTPPEANCMPWHPDETYQSGFHTRSDLCATCHDVSLPHFRWNGSSYVFNGTANRHPTGNKYEMVPIERTYSEWLNSDFAVGPGVDMGGRFGGPGQTVVGSCQDCHMPYTTDYGCAYEEPRSDLRNHTFHGASTWILDAINSLYGPGSANQDFDEFARDALIANKARNVVMLRLAADLLLSLDDSQSPGIDQLKVRVVNQSGHKLPSGYPEGRRIWITVQFFDCIDYETPIHQYGAYDFETATLSVTTTKVYEMKGGLDAHVAALTGHPAGPNFRFALTNAIFKDNRIPPRGFNNTSFAAVGAAPVGYDYPNGQHWDDTYFPIVSGWPVEARVRLYYQATSREYIEFLRDNNPNPGNPNNAGQVLYQQWLAHGKGAPVLMAESMIPVILKGDVNGDRQVTIADIPRFVDVLLGIDNDPRKVCVADFNSDESADGLDVQGFVQRLLGS